MIAKHLYPNLVMDELIAKGHVSRTANGEYALTDAGHIVALKVLSRLSFGNTILVGLHYAGELGVPIGEVQKR